MKKCLGSSIPNPMDLEMIERVGKWNMSYQVEHLVRMCRDLCDQTSAVDVFKRSGGGFKQLPLYVVIGIIRSHYPFGWRNLPIDMGAGGDSSATGPGYYQIRPFGLRYRVDTPSRNASAGTPTLDEMVEE